MNRHICDYCGKEFSTKSCLKTHVETAKKCLKLRGESNAKYTCIFCDKIFNLKQGYERHIEICKVKKVETQTEIKEENLKLKFQVVELLSAKRYLEQQLKESNDTIAELKKQNDTITQKLLDKATSSTTSVSYNKCNVQNLTPMTVEGIKEYNKKNLLMKHVEDIVSIAEYAAEGPLKDKVVCTDVNRKTFRIMNEDGEVVKDPKGNFTSKTFFAGTVDEISILLQEKIDKIFEYKRNNPTLDDALCHHKLTLCITLKNMLEISKGKKTELTEEFLRELALIVSV